MYETHTHRANITLNGETDASPLTSKVNKVLNKTRMWCIRHCTWGLNSSFIERQEKIKGIKIKKKKFSFEDDIWCTQSKRVKKIRISKLTRLKDTRSNAKIKHIYMCHLVIKSKKFTKKQQINNLDNFPCNRLLHRSEKELLQESSTCKLVNLKNAEK